MHPNRRRKKRPNYGLRTVEVHRGPNGFGFTISGQQPCILSCIVAGSPADQAGLRAGDFLISVDGQSVSKQTHDAVVALIGNSIAPIRMTIAENYYSDSSDDEIERTPMHAARKPKHHPHHKKIHHLRTKDTTNAMEYRAVVGYLGTIEMPRELSPQTRARTVGSCVRKLRQEKRPPTTILMTVLPTCLTLKNAANNIIAIYPSNRVVYAGLGPPLNEQRESRYFGLVTSAICEAVDERRRQLEVSNSCHVFVTDVKLLDHAMHVKRADAFGVICTRDLISGSCLEFPRNAIYVVGLIQTMYRLHNDMDNGDNRDVILANSPHPSASSNSDSGIGFRDDCCANDRILVVEFPTDDRLTCRALAQRRPLTPNGSDEDLRRRPLDGSTFKMPHMHNMRLKRKIANSCDGLDSKLSPKVYTTSSDDKSMNNTTIINTNERYMNGMMYGSLQELSKCELEQNSIILAAQSEPDVRLLRMDTMDCEPQGNADDDGDGSNGWSHGFEKLLTDSLGLHAFAEFLKKEFSIENIYFWTACERYRHLSTTTQRRNEAEKIFRRHLANGAPEAVNVDARARHYTEMSLDNAPSDLFALAQKQIFNLMKFDSYPRFLKSETLKKSNVDERLKQIEIDPLLSIIPHQETLTPIKLKKSLSNAEDRRRKSLLPWHRKNNNNHVIGGRSKSKDRTTDLIGPQSGNGDVYSSQSSLTSLDLANAIGGGGGNDAKDCPMRNGAALCRVILTNGSTTVVQIRMDETVGQLVERLLDKRGLNYTSFEVFTDKHHKPMDINESSTCLAGCEVTIEQRVVFKLDLPNRKVISVKSKSTKMITDVLRPILHKYDYDLDSMSVTSSGHAQRVNVALDGCVTTIDGARLRVAFRTNGVADENVAANGRLDEITNRVFEGILQDKVNKQQNEDATTKSTDEWGGSEHSSGIFGRFLRRDSAVHERKKKVNIEDNGMLMRKPLIAKLKSGVNKLQVACSESDELVEGLTRAQRARLEDQRGTEINFELPDFLKDKDDIQLSTPTSSSPTTSNHDTTIIENRPITNRLDGNEPPPLPPKPKFVPIRPPNWGQQNGFYKTTNQNTNKSIMVDCALGNKKGLYLEQPSSSFV